MTIYTFLPPPNQPYSFQPTLDGQAYSANVTWSLFGARWYLNIYAPSGLLIVSKALIGSPTAIQVQGVEWSNDYVTFITKEPHNIPILTTVDVVMRDFIPVALNGKWRAYVAGPDKLRAFLHVAPGAISSYGVIDNGINLVEGYFNESRMVFREFNQQFEVTP